MSNKNLELAARIINGTKSKKTKEFKVEGEKYTFEFTPFDQGDLEELQQIQNEGQKASMNMESKEINDEKDGKQAVKDRVARKKRKEKIREEVRKFEQEIELDRLSSKNNLVKYRSIEISTGIPEYDPEGPVDQKRLPPALLDMMMDYIIDVNNLTPKQLSIVSQFRDDE